MTDSFVEPQLFTSGAACKVVLKLIITIDIRGMDMCLDSDLRFCHMGDLRQQERISNLQSITEAHYIRCHR